MDEPRRDAGAAEVVGGLLMLTITLAVFLLLANAIFQQARKTGEYVESLVPERPTPEETPGVCLTFPDQPAWCRHIPGEQLGAKVCLVDSMGWPWCIEPPEPEPPGNGTGAR